MIRKRWRIPDLIDLEFFLSQDDGEDLDSLSARDRKIFSSLPEAVTTGEPTTRTLLFAWLAARRKATGDSDDEQPLPGRVWQEMFSLFFWGCLILGLISGAGLAFSFLSYSGTRPVNVSSYFGIFVLLQVFLFLLVILLFLYRSILGQSLDSSFLYRVLRRLFDKAMSGISRRAASRTGPETRLKWSVRAAGVNRLQQRYGLVFSRPFFLLAQLFGVGFNGGVLAATLVKVIGSDVAFGWQTTLQISSGALHSLVRWTSFPWSWFLPTYCCPSPDQIEGSKLILKDGIYHLTTHDLASWWPFLCLSVLFYGLLPRLVMLLAGAVRQRRDLSALRFDHGRYRQLIHRMRTPLVSTRAVTEEQRQQDREVAAAPVISVERDIEQPEQTIQIETPLIIALVPDELFDACAHVDLQEQVRSRLGYELEAILPIWTMDKGEEEELEEIKEKMDAGSSGDILLLQEAWQPPIQELLSFLQRLRETVGEQPTIIIALVGKPAADTILTPVTNLNLQIWQKKIAIQGDPGLQLVELIK